ncbi:MAG: hypothetical protein IJ572_01925 [Bacilli bacterium]|nr:hypothetical protein [Bacilli bacterium]
MKKVEENIAKLIEIEQFLFSLYNKLIYLEQKEKLTKDELLNLVELLKWCVIKEENYLLPLMDDEILNDTMQNMDENSFENLFILQRIANQLIERSLADHKILKDIINSKEYLIEEKYLDMLAYSGIDNTYLKKQMMQNKEEYQKKIIAKENITLVQLALKSHLLLKYISLEIKDENYSKRVKNNLIKLKYDIISHSHNLEKSFLKNPTSPELSNRYFKLLDDLYKVNEDEMIYNNSLFSVNVYNSMKEISERKKERYESDDELLDDIVFYCNTKASYNMIIDKKLKDTIQEEMILPLFQVKSKVDGNIIIKTLFLK